jgi:hypothetical protein
MYKSDRDDPVTVVGFFTTIFSYQISETFDYQRTVGFSCSYLTFSLSLFCLFISSHK